MKVFGGNLYVHYGQAYVDASTGNGSDLKASFHGQSNGLCGAAIRGNLFLITGLHTGHVRLTVSITETEPPVNDEWEDIVKVPYATDGKSTFIRDWNGKKVCDVPLVGTTFRVRYCAKSMDEGREADTIVDEEPIDSYALIFWPDSEKSNSEKPDKVIKQSSKIADHWHNWVRKLT